MPLRIALQMDPIGGINLRSDTTYRLGLEAVARGHELWYYTPKDLSYREGKIVAHAARLTLRIDLQNYFSLSEAEHISLDQMQVILLRQDPPFDMAYLTTTYLLESLLPKVLVSNHPASVRNLPEKWFPTQFAQFMPPTLISSDKKLIEQFRADMGDIVIKPLYGFGGGGVFKMTRDDSNFSAVLELLQEHDSVPLMAQRFLPEVNTGDRRIIFIDGDVAAVFARLPAEGNIRANMRVGGTPAAAELTVKQKIICDALAPVLKEKHIHLAGVDVIGDYLTEINITSPTGFAAVENLYGQNLAALYWDKIEKKLK